MSYCRPVVPNGWPSRGGCGSGRNPSCGMRYGSRVPAFGSASKGASTATEMKHITITNPAIDKGLRFIRRVKSDGNDQNMPMATITTRNAATSRGCWTTLSRTGGVATAARTRASAATVTPRILGAHDVRFRAVRMTLIVSLLEANAGIDRRVQDIGRQVAQHRQHRHEHPKAGHTGDIQLHGGLRAPLADARVVEDRFSQHHPAQ